jgi:hypothetical protein
MVLALHCADLLLTVTLLAAVLAACYKHMTAGCHTVCVWYGMFCAWLYHSCVALSGLAGAPTAEFARVCASYGTGQGMIVHATALVAMNTCVVVAAVGCASTCAYTMLCTRAAHVSV